MGWDRKKIQKVGLINLVGFSGEISLIIRKVTLLVETHEVSIYSIKMVIDANSAFNVILVRPWLHDMYAILPSYHQMIKL